MYYLNKIVWFWLNPLMIPLVGLIAAFLWRKRLLAFLAIAVLWFESTMLCVCLLGLPLERPYLPTQSIESLPKADAIVLLGGGIGKCDELVYPDMYEGADRLWHAARLWKAGKAPQIVVSGSNDLYAAVPLLLDLGVPRGAIVVDNDSRNTYENSRFTERLLKAESEGASGGQSVLLVTSAWHMPRACGNFSKTSLRVVPAACDFSVHNAYHGMSYWWDWITPRADALGRTYYLMKEWVGRLARR